MLRYKIGTLFVFILCLFSYNFVNANQTDLPLLGRVIYLDPGHGGVDPGAMYKGIMEKDINLKISKKIEEKLTKLGAIVYLTRYGDYDLSVNYTINRKRSDLSRRGNIINQSGCDMFLSIHLNAEDTGTWRGAQVFYDDVNKQNEKIAKVFQNLFVKKLNSSRKYKKTDEMYLQKRVKQPGILIELGFLSNSNDRYLLKQDSYQEKISNIVAEGLIEYFSK